MVYTDQAVRTESESPVRFKPAKNARGRLPALPALTGLRFWAAFAVFLLHSVLLLRLYPFMTSDIGRKISSDIFPMQLGASGVAFFFVLSGFIIDWSFDSKKDTFRAFYRRRILKIFPSHLIAALLVAAVLAVPLEKLAGMWPNFLLIHTWSESWLMKAQLNAPSWSLCSEILFYFSFPLLVPLVNRIRGKYIWWSIGILIALLLVLHFVIYFTTTTMDLSSLGSMYPHSDTSPDVSYSSNAALMQMMGGSGDLMRGSWLSYEFPPSRLLEFFVGVMFCRLVKSGMWKVIDLKWPLIVCVSAYALTYVVPQTFKTSMVMVLPLAALVATYAVRDLNGRRGFVSSRFGVWLGNISFAFYMVGYVVQSLLQRTVIAGHGWGFWGYVFITALTFVLQIPLAAALYHWVDNPIMTRWARKRPKPVATEQASAK